MRFVVLFDSCVLYSAPLRDFVLRLAMTGLFAAKWTDKIHDEWVRNVLKTRPELKTKLERTRSLMNQAVNDCLVTGYESLIDKLNLPDADDRHVLAAAIRCSAQIIVTFNLKHFPKKDLTSYDVEAMHPDIFIENQLDLNQGVVIGAAKQHRSALIAPTKSPDEYIETLAAQGMVVTADRLRRFRDLI